MCNDSVWSVGVVSGRGAPLNHLYNYIANETLIAGHISVGPYILYIYILYIYIYYIYIYTIYIYILYIYTYYIYIHTIYIYILYIYILYSLCTNQWEGVSVYSVQ